MLGLPARIVSYGVDGVRMLQDVLLERNNNGRMQSESWNGNRQSGFR